MKKRLLSAFLAVMMVLTMAPMAFAAEDDNDVASQSTSVSLPADHTGNFTISDDGAVLDGTGVTYTNGTITVTAEDVTIKNLTFGDKANLVVNTSGKFTLTGCTFATETETVKNSAGDWLPVRTAVKLNVGEAEVTNNTFKGVTNGYYNAIEFGIGFDNNNLKAATISGNTFNSAIVNNYFSFYNMTDNAKIDIVNNKMLLSNKASNGIRISNFRNATGVVFNIDSDEYTYATDSADSEYEGLILLQDYFDDSDSNVQDFSGITINVTNLSAPKDAKQLLYVYDNHTNSIITTNQPKLTGDDSLAKFYAAKIGNTYYKTLTDAIAAAQDKDTVKLLKDTTEKVGVSTDQKLTIDLDGHTWTGVTVANSQTEKETIAFQASAGNVVIENGTIAGRVNVYDASYVTIAKDVVIKNAPVEGYPTIGAGIVVWGDGQYGKENCKTPVLDLYGSVITTGEIFAISTNGSDTSKPILNIHDGAKVTAADNSMAVYLPSGNLTIDGGNITGGTAVYFKSTDMILSGGTFTGIGEKKDYEFYGNGANPTGDAVVIDNCNYPNGIGNVQITGGNYTSNHANAVGSYVGNGQTKPLTGFITGGYFTTDPSAYVASGYVAGTSDVSGYDYKVTKTNTGNVEVKPAVAAPEVKVSDSISKEDEEKVEEAAKTVSAPTLGAETGDIVKNIDEAKATELVNSAKDVTGDKKLYVQSSLKVEPTAYDKENKTLALEITPQYRIVASTAATADEIEVGENAQVVQGYQTMTIDTPTEVTMELPTGFAVDGDKLSIKHTKSNGTVEYYTGVVKADGDKLYLTFTTNGFSPFVISAPAASIGDNVYPTLQAAVDSAKNGDTIDLKQNVAADTKVTVAKTIKFTIDTNGNTFDKDKNIVAGSNTTAEVAVGNDTVTYQFTYTKPSSGGSSSGGGSSANTFNVTTSAVNNGGVNASPSKAAKGKTITITLSPDKGYKLDKLTVTDGSGKSIATTKKSDTVYTFTMPASQVKVGVSYVKIDSEPAQTTGYSDVAANDWFADAVQYVSDKGMMNGTGKNTFGPQLTTTRGMIVTVLYRLEKEPAASAASFTDVASGEYYTNAVAWANANGIVSGYGNGKFGPNDTITREQLAAILYRYAQFKKFGTSASANLDSYVDAQSVSSYAVPAIQWACGAGIVTGKTGSKLDPKGSATRAEVAAMLMRFCENVK